MYRKFIKGYNICYNLALSNYGFVSLGHFDLKKDVFVFPKRGIRLFNAKARNWRLGNLARWHKLTVQVVQLHISGADPVLVIRYTGVGPHQLVALVPDGRLCDHFLVCGKLDVINYVISKGSSSIEDHVSLVQPLGLVATP